MIPKKILVISDVPSHPQNVGNKARIFVFLSNLKKLGHEVHFLYENREVSRIIPKKLDIKAMKKSWDKVYVIKFNSYALFCFFDKEIGKLGKFLEKNLPRVYIILKKWKKKFEIQKFSEIDDLYNPAVDKFVKKLSNKEKFDIVLVQYVHQSKALNHFDDSVLKIIDTHDAMTRKDSFSANKRNKKIIAYSKGEEAKALNRSDIIVAIQDEEKKYFETLTNKKVVTIGHIINVHRPIKRESERKNILFVGFINSANIHGINFFIKRVFPNIRKKFSNAQLVVVGEVCKFTSHKEGVIKRGLVKDLEKEYAKADVVICPLFFGTGLKIKNVEALAHAKPLVTTSFGSIGIEKEKNKPFLIADTAKEFTEAIEKIFSDKKLYEKLSRNATLFMKESNKKNFETLKRVF